MALCSLFSSRPKPRQVLQSRQQQQQQQQQWSLNFPPPPRSPLACGLFILTVAVLLVFSSWTTKLQRYRILSQNPIMLQLQETSKISQFQAQIFSSPPPPPPPPQQPLQSQESRNKNMGPYHNWEIFSADYQEMLRNFKIFVYPDVYSSKKTKNSNSPNYDSIFLPFENPTNPKIGNYYSEHAFKVALLKSSLITNLPEEASFFFMPFSINAMRNHPLLHSASSISDFLANYTKRISSEFAFWNASAGADHFFVCCHSIGRDAASKHPDLHKNAIQVTCSSSYFQRFYIAHKDVGLPQVWPRKNDHRGEFNPPDARDILVFFAGRAQNSLVRQKILDLWRNDTSFAISSGGSSIPYEEGFRRSRYCLHVKGYEVNTARISDAIHFGCIPVIISNYYDLPLASVLDWSEFSIIINEGDVAVLKDILLSVSKETYLKLYKNLSFVRRHFAWHTPPKNYDSFYMTTYQLWLKRGLQRIS
ncbi:hypothetical protein ACH5RR_017673 [Cinchona calisaya]|uniref:Exostosin GT47 domain-containing protein n=1 Tax=Cinchona calisaya TaxID=153742 RepID=A0ABD2ZJA0_9GENT